MTHTFRLFPDAIVCVDESEAEDYRDYPRVLLHPPLSGLPSILNWIIASPDIPGQDLLIVDDDMKSFVSVFSEENKTRRLCDPHEVMAVCENCREMALGFGARLWGFPCNFRSDGFPAFNPMSLNSRISSLRGISDRNIRLDERFRRHDDVDLALTELLHRRVTFRDNRFVVVFEPVYANPGGSASDYLDLDVFKERLLLKQKWGPYVSFVETTNRVTETHTHVDR